MTSLPASMPTSALRPSSAGTMLEPIGADAEHLERHRHRVGGELAAAGAGAGAGDALELGELLVAHLPDGVLADGLEDLLDRDVLAVERPGWIEPE